MSPKRGIAVPQQIRIEHELGDAFPIAKVDEDAPAVVAVLCHPSEKNDGLALIGGAELVAMMGALQFIDESGHGAGSHGTMAAMNSPMGRRTGAAMAAVCAFAPALLAALRVTHTASAACDEGVARVIGIAPVPWRALDVAFDNLLALVPIGTLVARSQISSGLIAAASSVILFRLGRRLLFSGVGRGRAAIIVAAIAALTATLGNPWQTEAVMVGGSVTGAMLIVTPLALVAGRDPEGCRTSWMATAFVLAAAAGYEPLDGMCAFAACSAFLASTSRSRRCLAAAWRAHGAAASAAAILGLAPWLVAIVHVRRDGVPLEPALARGWLGDASASVADSPTRFLQTDAGPVFLVLAVTGAAIAARFERARPLTAALVVIAALGLACAWVGAPAGPMRFGAPVLAAHAALALLAGVALQAAVRAAATARLPMARASAAMVLLIAMVFPVEAADDVLAQSAQDSESAEAATLWNEVAWGTLPPNSIVVVGDPSVLSRARAARGQGQLRDDILVVATCSGCEPPWREITREPSLVPFWRDIELTGTPTEGSLSFAAAARPLVTAYDRRWGAAIGRHLVPLALFDRFEVEPRGSSDRRRALDATAPARERLAKRAANQPDLAQASASLLRARAFVMEASGDRALAERAEADARAYPR
jgi:hypothetical protein